MRAAFAAVTPFAATTITISGTSALYTFTSSVGTPTFLTLGLKIGDVVRLSAAGGTAGIRQITFWLSVLLPKIYLPELR